MAVLLVADAVSVQSQAITFVAVGAFFSLITLVYTTRSKRKDKAIATADEIAKEDRQEKRLAKVEQQAAEAAKLLVESNVRQQERAHAQMAVLDTLEQHTIRIERSQDIMHAMLNSAQTTQMIAYIVTMKTSRASLRTQYAQMRELAMLRAGENQLSDQVVAELAALQEQITQLGSEISAQQDAVDDRVRAQELAESRERNKTRDNTLNQVSAMVPAGTTDPTSTPAAGTPTTAGSPPAIQIENATIQAGTVNVESKPGQGAP